MYAILTAIMFQTDVVCDFDPGRLVASVGRGCVGRVVVVVASVVVFVMVMLDVGVGGVAV